MNDTGKCRRADGTCKDTTYRRGTRGIEKFCCPECRLGKPKPGTATQVSPPEKR